MACFLVPLGEAVVTTVVQKAMQKRERSIGGDQRERKGFSWSRRLGWLNKMLWGGSILLAFEHVWHGEVVPWPPFLTAMQNPADAAAMLHEIATVGVAMAFATTALWGIVVIVAELKAKTPGRVKAAPATGTGGKE